ncbi:MipA/OmpV family protein [Geminicoccus flavidas]|uniref:MipA/OmpV family protein n=1 Tax=Geminicoccus flavidas TaxID=2506407 RepID=UPI001F2F8297|nr:MipA/OmpV family protein [Geminicoccus flavidas]
MFADWVERYGPWTFSGGPRAVWGNAAFMQDRFGISPAAAARSGLAAFDADAGFGSVGMTLAVSYALSPSWTVTLYDTYGRLVGDAAESPIVTTIGSRNQNVLGVSLEYTFDTGL